MRMEAQQTKSALALPARYSVDIHSYTFLQVRSKTFCCTISLKFRFWNALIFISSNIIEVLMDSKQTVASDHRFCQTSKSFWQEITGATHSWATKHWIEPAYCHRRMSAEWVPNAATKSASSSSSWTPPNSIIPARIAWKWQQLPEFGALKIKQDLEKKYTSKYEVSPKLWSRITDFLASPLVQSIKRPAACGNIRTCWSSAKNPCFWWSNLEQESISVFHHGLFESLAPSLQHLSW